MRGPSSHPDFGWRPRAEGERVVLRVCACVACAAHPGSCPQLSTGRYCGPDENNCAGQREQARGSRQQRGYGRVHDARRAELLRTWIPGTPCPKCRRPQWNPELLDAGHSVDLRVNPDAVADQLECRSCNRGWRRGA